MAKFPLHNQPHRMSAELRGQHAVEGRRRAASLQMTQHDGPRLLADPPLDFIADKIADPTQPNLLLRLTLVLRNEAPVGQFRAFGYHNQREFLAPLLALENRLTDA